MKLTGASSDDWFDFRVNALGLAQVTQGYRVTLDRMFKGIPVVGDEIRVYFAFTGGKSFELQTDKDGQLSLAIRRPDPHEPLCLLGIESSVTRDLDKFVTELQPAFAPDEAKVVAEIATGVPSDDQEVHLVVWKKKDIPRLAWSVALYQGGLQQALVILDALTGEVLDDQRPAPFRALVPASNPHEPYTDGQQKTLKPFPFVKVYSAVDQVPCQGAPGGGIWRGSPSHYLGTSDYHGNLNFADPGGWPFLDHQFQSANQSTKELDQVSSLGCGVNDAHCEWCRSGSWVHCQDQTCDNYATLDYWFPVLRSGGDLEAYWLPIDSTYSCPQDPRVRAWVGTSPRTGRRQEMLYHAAIAQHFWHDWLMAPPHQATLRIQSNLWSNPNPGCPGGVTYGNGLVEIGCDICSFEQQNLKYHWEAITRSTTYHELGHVADLGMHEDQYGNFHFSKHPDDDIDLPLNNQTGSSLTEAIAMLSQHAVSYFEDSDFLDLYGSPVDTHLYRTYPYGYVCGCGSDCLYTRAYLWLNVWLDFLFMTGLPVGMPVLREHIGSDDFLGGLHLLDRRCIDTFDYSSCVSNAYGDTYYKRMFNSSQIWTPDYHLTYETTRAWQNRVTDWDPGILGQADCDGVHPVRDPNDPNRYDNFAPWFDDVTNVAWFAPFLPLDTHGTVVNFQNYGYGLRFGPFADAPATCRSREQQAQCKELAIDYASDRDKFIFLGRRGQQYFIYTTAGDGSWAGTDTILEVRSSTDQVLQTNDDCWDSEMPPYGTLYSCLRFTPQSTSPYRLAVRAYSGSPTGSRARYRLVVETRGDDYPSYMQDASPAPVAWYSGWVDSPTDRDWFYQTLLSASQMTLVVAPLSGYPIEVFVQDHWGNIVLGPQRVEAYSRFDLGTRAKGTYYLRVRFPPDCSTCSQGGYVFSWTNTSSVSGGQGSAFAVGDPAVPAPLPTTAYTAAIANAHGKHYYRANLRTGEICIVDAHAVSGQVALMVEPDKRSSTPAYDRIVASAPADSWQTLVEDQHGGMVAMGQKKKNAHLPFVAPWKGDYFFVVEAEEAPASYTLWVGCGLVWSNLPEFP
jgi:hypothetical protein